MTEYRPAPKCCICHKGLNDGVSLHRINATGVPGIWACLKHIKQTDASPIPDDILAIVKAISGEK